LQLGGIHGGNGSATRHAIGRKTGTVLDRRGLDRQAVAMIDVLGGSLGLPPAPGIYGGGLPIQEIFGLPVHPLVVHAVVVLVPLASLGLILMASSIKRSKRYGGLITLIAGVAAASAFLAMASGRDLADRFGYGAQEHFAMGQWMPWVGLAVFVNCLLLWLVDKKPPNRSLPGTVLSIAGFVVAALAIAATVYTGHLGAELVWGS
jgi:uncharacterized membrane protein